MESVLEGSEHLERELAPEPIAGPAAGSVVLHLALVGMLVSYGVGAGAVSSQLVGQPGRGRSDAGEPGEQRASAAQPTR